MSYCSKCGSYIPDSALTCPACGRPKFGAADSAQTQERRKNSGSQAAWQQAPRPEPESSTGKDANSYSYSYQYDPPAGDEDAYRDFSADDASAGEDNVISALGYLGPMVLLPLLAKPDSEFARFHANQSLSLIIFSILCSIAGVVPAVGWMASAFGGIFTVYGVIKGMSNAIRGKMEKLPLIGDMNILGKFGGKK